MSMCSGKLHEKSLNVNDESRIYPNEDICSLFGVKHFDGSSEASYEDMNIPIEFKIMSSIPTEVKSVQDECQTENTTISLPCKYSRNDQCFEMTNVGSIENLHEDTEKGEVRAMPAKFKRIKGDCQMNMKMTNVQTKEPGVKTMPPCNEQNSNRKWCWMCLIAFTVMVVIISFATAATTTYLMTKITVWDELQDTTRILGKKINDLEANQFDVNSTVSQVSSEMSVINKTVREEFHKTTEIIDGKINFLEANQSALHSALFTVVQEINKKVGITACVINSDTFQEGTAITFPDIKTVYNFSKTVEFTTSGTFTCETSGLYLIAVTIRSSETNGHFYLYKNNDGLSQGYIYSGNGAYHTGTAVAVVHMDINDGITVKTGSTMDIINYSSCITIIKL